MNGFALQPAFESFHSAFRAGQAIFAAGRWRPIHFAVVPAWRGALAGPLGLSGE
jgi:hypothetical protein